MLLIFFIKQVLFFKQIFRPLKRILKQVLILLPWATDVSSFFSFFFFLFASFHFFFFFFSFVSYRPAERAKLWLRT
jgi:uncharacterized membrane protein